MRKRLVGLVGAMVVAIAGTTFAGSTSQQGYVDGLTCVGYLTTTASSVVATTKCVPANSSYIYAKATAYMYPNGVQKTSTNNVANYTGEMEVSTVASGSNIHHGRGIHSVNSWTVETTATK